VPNKTPRKVIRPYFREIISRISELMASRPNGLNTIRNKKTNSENNMAVIILLFIPGLYGNGCLKTFSIFILLRF
jgi:hypothetical protein